MPAWSSPTSVARSADPAPGPRSAKHSGNVPRSGTASRHSARTRSCHHLLCALLVLTNLEVNR